MQKRLSKAFYRLLDFGILAREKQFIVSGRLSFTELQLFADVGGFHKHVLHSDSCSYVFNPTRLSNWSVIVLSSIFQRAPRLYGQRNFIDLQKKEIVGNRSMVIKQHRKKQFVPTLKCKIEKMQYDLSWWHLRSTIFQTTTTLQFDQSIVCGCWLKNVKPFSQLLSLLQRLRRYPAFPLLFHAGRKGASSGLLRVAICLETDFRSTLWYQGFYSWYHWLKWTHAFVLLASFRKTGWID